MMKFFGGILPISAILLQSCADIPATLSKPVPIGDALAIVEKQLNASSPVNLSDVGTPRESFIIDDIHLAQCVIPTSPNPYVPVITGAVNITLQGSFQYQGTGNIGLPPSFGISVGRSNLQQVTVPITFVSLQGLPNFYMAIQLANLTNLDAGGKDATTGGLSVSAIKTNEVAVITAKRDKLRTLVNAEMGNFENTVKSCKYDKYGNPTVGPIIPQIQAR